MNEFGWDTPTKQVHVVVVEVRVTCDKWENRYSRPYRDLKTARMRLCSILRENPDITNGWVESFFLAGKTVTEWNA